MALIKFLRGSSQNISFDKTPYNDGYLYFTTDDGKLYIDANGERIKMNPDQIGCVWGVCETAGSLSAKEITLDEFKLEVGTSIKVKFISSNEVENPTLNINNTGAYPITYRGSAIRPDYLSANGVFEFAFDGDSWEYVGIINSAKEDLDVLFLENVEISTLSWEEDPSYPDYPYSAKIVCQGVTENHFPNVVFSTIDANSGNFAPVTKTEKNLIYIYAKEIPADDITIPSIELTPFDEGNAAVVVLDATLTKEGMAADAKAVGDKFTAIEKQVNKLDKSDKLIYDGTLSNFVEQSDNKYLYTEKIERASIFFDPYKNYRIVLDGIDYYPLEFYTKSYNSINNETRDYYGIETSDGKIQIEVKPGYLDRSRTEDTFRVFMNNIEESHSLQIYEIQDFTEKLLLKETLTDFIPETEGSKVLYYAKDVSDLSLDFITPNRLYKVIFDNKTYYLKAQADSEGAVVLGEKYILFGIHLADDIDIHCEECPFCILIGSDNQLSILAIEDKESHSIEIYQTILNEKIVVDATMTKSGAAADAKVVGDMVAEVDDILKDIYNKIGTLESKKSEEAIFEEVPVESVYYSLGGSVSTYLSLVLNDTKFIEGESYALYVDGIRYESVAYNADALIPDSTAIGNGSQLGLPGNGEPVAALAYSNAIGVIFLEDTEPTKHTIALYKITNNKESESLFENKVIYENITLSSEFLNLGDGLAYGFNLPFKCVLEEGKEYIVHFDGETYQCKAFSSDALSPGSTSIGNGSQFGLPGNNEPFAFGTFEGGNTAMGLVVCLQDTAVTEHTISLYEKYDFPEGVVSWNDLADRPFGEENAVILDAEFVDDGDSNDDEAMAFYIDPSSATLNIGQEYVVTINGTEYKCVAFDGDGLIAVGNPTHVSNVEEDNGLPFVITRDLAGMLIGIPIWLLMTPRSLIPAVNDVWSVSISGNSVKCLDNKYLSIMESTPATEVALLENYVAEMIVESDGVYHCGIPSSPVELVGDVKYRINWDGTDYTYTSISFEEAEIGVGSAMTLDPFLIGYNSNDNILQIYTASTEATHTISITQINEASYKIKEEYLPDNSTGNSGNSIPEYNLAEMGLPALVPNGGEVSVQCDCTELCAALEQGATKISFMANVGQEVPVSGTVNAMKMLNGYSCGFVGCYTGIPMILSFDIYTNQITGRIISILQAVL